MTRRKVASRSATIPVVQEDVKVGRRKVETGRVVINKRVEQREQIIDEPLLQEQVLIKRVPVNRPIARRLNVRREGDIMIIPIMEEVLVVEKRLILKEELHVRRRRIRTRQRQRITLRGERAEIKRLPPPAQP